MDPELPFRNSFASAVTSSCLPSFSVLCRFLQSRSTPGQNRARASFPRPVPYFLCNALRLFPNCFPYSMLCLARLEQRMRPLFFFCFLLPLQYSGLVCHIPRLVRDSHQPHNTNLKEQHVRLFPFPYSVHTWDHFTFLWNICPTPSVSQHFALSKN